MVAAEAAASALLEAAAYTTSSTFDALGRAVTTATADNSITEPAFGRSGRVVAVRVRHRGRGPRCAALVETRLVKNSAPEPTSRWRLQLNNHVRSACVETTLEGATARQAHDSTLEANPKRYRYSGKERDDETGLYYYGARYLAPWLGRWVSTEPSGTVDGLNVYGFVRGRPSGLFDPNGAQCIDGSAGTNSCGDPNAGTLMTQPDVEVAQEMARFESSWVFRNFRGSERPLTMEEREEFAANAARSAAVSVPDAETRALVEVTADARSYAAAQATVATNLHANGAAASVETLGVVTMVATARSEARLESSMEMFDDAARLMSSADNVPTNVDFSPLASETVSALPDAARAVDTSVPAGLTRARSEVTRARLGITGDTSQVAHHLIPVEIAARFDVLRYAAENLGFDINAAHFLKPMPRATDQIAGSFSAHRGPHPNYTAAVWDELEEIELDWNAGRLDDAQLSTRLRDLADELSLRIDAGEFTNADGRLTALPTHPTWRAA